ncbi:MAG: metallophosphoesterase [Desulfosalsimonadaceae bacterium]
MSLRLAIFLASIVLIIFSMHWLFIKSIIRFFSITAPLSKAALYTAMVLLTAIVISGFMVARIHETWWITGYYRFASAWLGFLIHFLVAAAAVWIAGTALYFTRLPIERNAIAAIFLLAACAYSIYGIFNAFTPRIREIPVYLDDVPAAWENSKIVHLSDIHLGRVHGKKFAENLAQTVNRINPDIVLITGDILDGMGGKWHGDLALQLDNIKAGKGVFYVTGNHEGYIGERRALQLLEKTNMTILDNRLIEIDGLEILGISYPGIHSMKEIAGLPEGGKKGNDAVRILLFHTPTSVLHQEGDRLDRHFHTYWMPDISFSCNRNLHVDLQLSGHTHHGQLFPANLVTRLLYRGFDYGLNKSGESWIYTTSGVGTWGPPMRTATISEIAVIRLRENNKKNNHEKE